MGADEVTREPYHGIWGVNGDGEMTGPNGITPTEEERDAFIGRIRAKIDAGTASMTERRCLAAVRSRMAADVSTAAES